MSQPLKPTAQPVDGQDPTPVAHTCQPSGQEPGAWEGPQVLFPQNLKMLSPCLRLALLTPETLCTRPFRLLLPKSGQAGRRKETENAAAAAF